MNNFCLSFASKWNSRKATLLAAQSLHASPQRWSLATSKFGFSPGVDTLYFCSQQRDHRTLGVVKQQQQIELGNSDVFL